MNLNLDEIYDKGVNDPPPDEQVVNPSNTTAKPYVVPDLRTPTGSDATISPYSSKDYTGYFKEPLNINKFDPDTRRGLAQSGWDKFGNFTAQTGLKTITGITEGLGYLGSLVGEWGTDRDYANPVTEASKQASSWVDANFPLYRHNNDTWALNDASWWLQNAQGLISSVGAFALEGGIFGAAVNASKVGEALELVAGASKLGLRTSRAIGQTSKELITSGLLAYTEGAMSGKRVFDTVYQTQLQKNLSKGLSLEQADEDAKYTASQSAATAVQLNTIINTGSNFLGGVGEFFNHEKSAVIKAVEKNLLAKNGEDIATTLSRLGTETAEKYAKELGTKKSLSKIIREPVAEGIEELTNQFAEKTGIEEGQEGRTHGFLNQLGQLENYFKRTMDSEGALNFVMGAIAGPLQHTLAANLPIHRIETGSKVDEEGKLILDEQGKEQKQYVPGVLGTNLVRKQTVNQFGANEYFTKIKDKIVADYTELARVQKEIDYAVATGNSVLADSLREQLFNVANLNSVKMGFGESMKETYRSILNLDNTRSPLDEKKETVAQLTEQLQQAKDKGEDTTELEANLKSLTEDIPITPDVTPAMKLNMTDSRENNDYKKKAEDAIKTLDELQSIHDTVMKKYGSDMNMDPENQHVSDMIFNKLGNLHLLKKEKTNIEKQLADLDAPDAIDFLTSSLVQEHDRKIDRLRDRLLVTEQDIADFKGSDPIKHKALIAKYGAIGVDDSDISSALTAVGKKLNQIQSNVTEQIDSEHQSILNSEYYQKWADKNKDGNYTEFEKSLPESVKDSKLQKMLSQHLSNLENQIQTHTEFANELQQAPTLTKVIKNTTKYFEKLRNQEVMESLELLKEQETRIETAKLAKKRRYLEAHRLQTKYSKELEDIQKEKEAIVKELDKLEDSINLLLLNMSDSDAPYKLQEWKDKRNELNQRQADIKDRITVLQTLWNQAEEVKVASVEPVQEEEVKNETEEPETPPTEEPEIVTEPTEEALPIETKTEVEPIQTPKMDSLMSMLQEIPDNDKVSERFKDDKVTSLDSLKDLKLGKFTSPQVVLVFREAMQEAGVVLQDLQEDEAEMEVDTTMEVEPDIELSISSTEATIDGIQTKNSKPEPGQETPDNSKWFGKKQIDPSNSGAVMTSEYRETEKMVDGELVKNKESTGKLNKDTNTDILNPRKLLTGTAVRLELDTEAEDFQQMLDADDSDNIPIKIVYPDGKKTGTYLHTVSWVTEEITGSTSDERFRNTVDVVKDSQGEILWEDNVHKEADALRELRTKLVQKFKTDGLGVDTSILDKGEGTVEFDFNYRPASGPTGLPGVQLGIVKGNSIITAATGGQDITVPEEWEGRTVGMIRSANGSLVPVTLQGNLLFERGQESRDYTNFVRITELHLTPNLTKSQEEAKVIEEATGFKILTQQGYRDYIVQHFTYLTTEADFIKSGAQNFIDVRRPIEGELNSQIKIGNWFQGSVSPTSTILAIDGKTGRLKLEHKKAIQDLFSKRFKSVSLENTDRGIQGIQSTGEFKEVNYDGKSWTVTKNTDYTSYIKKSLYTNVKYYGKSGDTHVYFNNPIIKFDPDPILKLPTFEFKADFTMDVNPVDKFQSLLSKKTDQEKRIEVKQALRKAAKGEGGQFFVTLVDGSVEGSVLLSVVGDELFIGKEGTIVDLLLIKEVRDIDGILFYSNKEEPVPVVGTTDDTSKQVTAENLQKWYEEAEDHPDFNGADIAELSTSLSANGITFVESNPFLSPC